MSDQHAEDVHYVATGIIPPSPPPATAVGPVHWLRTNLFSSIGNALATLISIGLIVWLVMNLLDWAVIKGVVSPDEMSRRACFLQNEAAELHRMAVAQGLAGIDQILALPTAEQVPAFSERLGVEVRDIGMSYGACWAVIEERFLQFAFGFYPDDQYWRPILTFLLLAVALAPVLFSSVPRVLLWGTAVYPLVAYYLIWGGTFRWVALGLAGIVPALVVSRIVLVALEQLSVSKVIAPKIAHVAGFGATAPYWGLVLLAAVGIDSPLAISGPISDTWTLEPVESAQLGGFLLTLIIGLVGIAASFPIGIVLALGRKSNLMIVRNISIMFIEFIRGVPLITLLFVANVLLAYFLPPGTDFDKLLRVLIMVTLFSSAYMAEVIRGGLAALPQGQYEAADALGLNYWKSMRLIILPQALKISIPGIVNTFIGLFKDTTLVSIIGLFDPIGIIQPIRADAAWTGLYWEPYLFVAIFFWICCFSMSRYSMHLERKLATDNR